MKKFIIGVMGLCLCIPVSSQTLPNSTSCSKPNFNFSTSWRAPFWKARCYFYYQMSVSKNGRDSTEAYRKGIAFLNEAMQISKSKPETDIEFQDLEEINGKPIGLQQSFSANTTLIEAYGATFAPWGVDFTATLTGSGLFDTHTFNLKVLPVYEGDNTILYFDVPLSSSHKVPLLGEANTNRKLFAYLDVKERQFMTETFSLKKDQTINRLEFLRIYSPVWYDVATSDVIGWIKKGIKIKAAVSAGLAFTSGGAAPFLFLYEMKELYQEFYPDDESAKAMFVVQLADKTGESLLETSLDVIDEDLKHIQGLGEIRTDAFGKKLGADMAGKMVELMAERYLASAEVKLRETIRGAGESTGYHAEETYFNFYAIKAPRPPVLLFAQLSATHQASERPCYIGECYDETAWGTQIYQYTPSRVRANNASDKTLHEIITKQLGEINWIPSQRDQQKGFSKWWYLENNAFMQSINESKVISAEPTIQEVKFSLPKALLDSWATQVNIPPKKILEQLEVALFLNKSAQTSAHTPGLRSDYTQKTLLSNLEVRGSGESRNFHFGIINLRSPLGTDLGYALRTNPPNSRIPYFTFDLRPHKSYFLQIRIKPELTKPYINLGMIRADFNDKADGFDRKKVTHGDMAYFLDTVNGQLLEPDTPTQLDIALPLMNLEHKGRKMGPLLRLSFNPHIRYHQSGTIKTPGFSLIANEVHQAWATARYVKLRAPSNLRITKSVPIEVQLDYDKLSVANEEKYPYTKQSDTWVAAEGKNVVRFTGYELRKLNSGIGNKDAYWKMNITNATLLASSGVPKFDLPLQNENLSQPVVYMILLRWTLTVPPGVSIPGNTPLMVIEVEK